MSNQNTINTSSHGLMMDSDSFSRINTNCRDNKLLRIKKYFNKYNI